MKIPFSAIFFSLLGSGCAILSPGSQQEASLDLKLSRQVAQYEKKELPKAAKAGMVLGDGQDVDWKKLFKKLQPAASKLQRKSSPARGQGLPYDDIVSYLDGLRVSGDLEKANAKARFFLSKDSKNLELILVASGIFVASNHHKESLQVLSEAKKMLGTSLYSSPETVFHFRYLLALSYLGAGFFNKGREILSDLIALQKDFSPAYFALASYYLDRGKVEVAEFIAKRGLDNDRGNEELNSLLGKIYFDLGNTSLASTFIDRALKVNSNSVSSLTIRAQILVAKRQYDAAEQGLEKALRLAPKKSEIFVVLGVCQNQMGQTGRAKQSFERAIALDPENPVPRFNLAVLLSTDKKNRAKSSRLFSEVAALDGSSQNLKTAALQYLLISP